MSIEIDEITSKYTRQEFINKVVLTDCYKYNIRTKNLCNGNPVNFSKCKKCIKDSIKDIKFKDEVDKNKLTEDEVRIIANKVQEEYLLKENQELKDIKRMHECQIDELKAKVHSLEIPTTTCIIDPKSEREHYKFIAKENVRLKNIIKLIVESL